jgi:hypothetical protein
MPSYFCAVPNATGEITWIKDCVSVVDDDALSNVDAAMKPLVCLEASPKPVRDKLARLALAIEATLAGRSAEARTKVVAVSQQRSRRDEAHPGTLN